MITVYYAECFPFLQNDIFQYYLNKVESRRKEKILKQQKKKEQIRSLAAGSILHYALCQELGFLPDEMGYFELGYEAEGKPFLKEYADVHFNLSHSGEYVCCGMGREPVGVDIQKHRLVKDRLALRFFTQEDNRMLAECSAGEQEELFFRMWSIKESYLKLTGEGMKKGLDSFEIDWNQGAVFEKGGHAPAAFFHEKRDVPGYSFSVCAGNPLQQICFKEVTGIFSGENDND